MPDLDELVLTEPDVSAGEMAAARTLQEDIFASVEGFHWVGYCGRPGRVRDTSEWSAYAVLGGEIIARGTVAAVQLDHRAETAALEVEPPARVFAPVSYDES